MHGAFVRSEPTQLGMIRNAAGNRSEIRHQLFYFLAGKLRREHLDQFAYDPIAIPEGERHSNAHQIRPRFQQSHCQAILGFGMNRIASGAGGQRIPGIERMDGIDNGASPAHRYFRFTFTLTLLQSVQVYR